MENVIKMAAGRELDALVSEKVFRKDCGWVGLDNDRGSHCPSCHKLHRYEEENLPYYSSDIGAVWNIVDAFKAKRSGHDMFHLTVTKYGATASFEIDAYYNSWNPVSAPTAAHAICLAALNILEKENT